MMKKVYHIRKYFNNKKDFDKLVEIENIYKTIVDKVIKYNCTVETDDNENWILTDTKRGVIVFIAEYKES